MNKALFNQSIHPLGATRSLVHDCNHISSFIFTYRVVSLDFITSSPLHAKDDGRTVAYLFTPPLILYTRSLELCITRGKAIK